MVVLNKIYTKTGDDGTTGLGTGERRLKFDLRVEAYGTVDETNATIGVARLHTNEMPDLHAMLSRIQNDLFDLTAAHNEVDRGLLAVCEVDHAWFDCSVKGCDVGARLIEPGNIKNDPLPEFFLVFQLLRLK